MDIAEAMAKLRGGDHLLMSEGKTKLDRDGFVRLEKVLTQDHVDQINRRMDELLQKEGTEAGKEAHQNAPIRAGFADSVCNLFLPDLILNVQGIEDQVLIAFVSSQYFGFPMDEAGYCVGARRGGS